ncbi:MAG: RNA polymerase sigma factor [Dehalococcoidia bacterium]
MAFETPRVQQDGLVDVTLVTPPQPAPEVALDLIRRAVARDADAFAALYELHVSRIYRHVRYRLPDPDVAEDVTSQVFLRAWQAIDRYRPQEGRPFLAWLFTISNNLIIDYHRRSKREMTGIEAERHVATTPDPEEAAVTADLQQHVRAAISRLKPDYQLVLSLRLIEDMEYDDIARIVGKKPGALRVTLFRALQALREDLARRGVRP